jgi:hypothetical protein
MLTERVSPTDWQGRLDRAEESPETLALLRLLIRASSEQGRLQAAEAEAAAARQARDAAIAELSRPGGLPYHETATALGMTLQMVGKIAKRAGVTRRPRR